MNSHPRGTVEYYRSIFMAEGLREMISEITSIMRKGGEKVTPERLDIFIKGVLYGWNEDGTARNFPPQENFEDIKNDYGKFKFQQRVRQLWIKQRNR